MVLVLQLLRKRLHYVCTKTYLAVRFPPCVKFKATEVAVIAVSQFPHFPRLSGFAGMYCLSEERSWNLIMALSTARFFDGSYSAANLEPR